MMEHSQVRWAILLSFIPLKVRRMKSLALLWATAGPDCRSLKLYWVSAKALTLPISHHGSSQLSLPSGLIPSPERINTQSLCSLYTWAFSLLRSRPRSTSISSFFFFFGPSFVYHRRWIILSYMEVPCECSKRRACHFALMGILWFYRVVLQLESSSFLLSWINSLNTESQASDHQAGICQILLLWRAPWMRRCDEGGLGQRQVCRCNMAGLEV